MSNPNSRNLAAAAALLVVCVCLYFQVPDDDGDARETPDAPAPAPIPGAGGAEPSPAPPQDAALPADTGPAPPGDAAGESLSSRYARLTGSGSPQDAFEAYNLAMACIWAHAQPDDEPGQPPDPKPTPAQPVATACGDLTDDQFDSRLPHLRQAAEAGIPMAAIRLADEGPGGDRQVALDKPDDTAVVAWKEDMARLIQLAADKGDYIAMGSLANMYEEGDGVIGRKDPFKALEYATAMWELQQHATGKLSPVAAGRLSRLAQALSFEDAAAAREAGMQRAARLIEAQQSR